MKGRKCFSSATQQQLLQPETWHFQSPQKGGEKLWDRLPSRQHVEWYNIISQTKLEVVRWLTPTPSVLCHPQPENLIADAAVGMSGHRWPVRYLLNCIMCNVYYFNESERDQHHAFYM